jgi:hypothetical protein
MLSQYIIGVNMNSKLQSFSRKSLKEDLGKLPTGWQDKFKKIYGRMGKYRDVENVLDLSIDEVVDELPEKRLDWALQQVGNSLKKVEKEKEESRDIIKD